MRCHSCKTEALEGFKRCLKCLNDAKIYRDSHKKQIKEKSKIYNQTHKEQTRATKKIYLEKTKEYRKQQTKIYREKNKDKIIKHNKEKYQERRIAELRKPAHKSKGCLIIENYLLTNSILFIQEKRYDGCKDKKTLPFDYYLPDYNFLIEFDGTHHFKGNLRIKDLTKRIESLKIIQLHDQIKNQYARDHQIKLLRIKYDEKYIEELLEVAIG